mgnify:CR=1 FL=1
MVITGTYNKMPTWLAVVLSCSDRDTQLPAGLGVTWGLGPGPRPAVMTIRLVALHAVKRGGMNNKQVTRSH